MTRKIADDSETCPCLAGVRRLTDTVIHEINIGFQECMAGIATLDAKLDTMPRRRSRGGKYTDEVCIKCKAIWDRACSDMQLRTGLNTRVTYTAALRLYAQAFAEIGIDSPEKLRRVMHAIQSRLNRVAPAVSAKAPSASCC